MRFWGRFKLSGRWRWREIGRLDLYRLGSWPRARSFFIAAIPLGDAAASTNTLSDAQIAHMSSGALAKYVFDNQGCASCHTVSADGKLGFTERGKERARVLKDAPHC